MVFANDSMPLWRTESRNQSCRDGAVIPFGRTASIRLRISSGRRSWGRVVFLALVWPCIARQLDAGVGRNGQNVGGGIMLTRRLFGFEARAKGELVRAEGLEPSRTLRSNGFSYPATAFAAFAIVWRGLGSGLSLHRARIWLRVSGAARLVSTPSRPFRAGLGSGSPCYRVPRI